MIIRESVIRYLYLSTSMIFEYFKLVMFSEPSPFMLVLGREPRVAHGMRWVCDVIMWSLQTRIGKSPNCTVKHAYMYSVERNYSELHVMLLPTPNSWEVSVLGLVALSSVNGCWQMLRLA